VLRSQLLRQYAHHTDLPPRPTRGAGPRCTHRANLESGWSLAGLLTSPGVAVCTFGWEKSPQPTRDAHQSVSLSHGRPAGLRGGGVTAGARRHSTLCAAPQPTCSTQVYSGTKSAMEAMGAALRLELAPSEISVSSINPGCVRTEILNYAKKDDFQLPTDAAQVASC